MRWETRATRRSRPVSLEALENRWLLSASVVAAPDLAAPQAVTAVAAASVPSSMAGAAAVMSITGGSGYLASWGAYRVLFSSTSAAYWLEGISGVQNSSGTYAYAQNTTTRATLVVQDATAGWLTYTLSALTDTTGTFVGSGAAGTQTGSYTLFPAGHGIAPTSMAGCRLTVDIVSGGGDLASSGSYELFTGLTDNSYQVRGNADVTNSFGTYNYVKTGTSTAAWGAASSTNGALVSEELSFDSGTTGRFLISSPATGSWQAGTFTVTQRVTTPYLMHFAGSGNFTGSGHPELVRVDRSGTWWVAAGQNQEQAWGQWNVAVAWKDLATADLNGDGKTDVVGRTSGGAWWAGISTGTGFTTVNLGAWSPLVTWVDVHPGDINGDGKADLVGRTSYGYWWAGISNGTQITSVPLGAWSSAVTWVDVQVADLNGDGKADVLGRTSYGAWWAGYSTGAALNNIYLTSWSSLTGWHDVQLADLNGDGHLALVGRTDGGAWWGAVFNGTGYVNRALSTWSGAVPWYNVLMGDFNGDGKADILGRTVGGQWWASLSTNNSSFNITRVATWTSDSIWDDIRMVDVNQDSRGDLVATRFAGIETWATLSTGVVGTSVQWVG